MDERERLPGSRPAIPLTIINDIEKYMNENTYSASNRIIKRRAIGPYLPEFSSHNNSNENPDKRHKTYKNIDTVKYYTQSITNARYSFLQLNKKYSISLSTFRKYMQKKYKRPKRISDLCLYEL